MLRSSKILLGVAALAALTTAGNALAFQIVPFTGTPGTPYNNSPVPLAGYADFWTYNGNAQFQSLGKGQNKVYEFSYTMSSSAAAVFNFPSGAYVVTNPQVTVTAFWSGSDNFLTSYNGQASSYVITGTAASNGGTVLPGSNMPSYGTGPTGNTWTTVTGTKNNPVVLFSANLTGANVDLNNGALGFSTNNFGGWANQPQFAGTSESLWIYRQLTCQTSNQSAPLCSNKTATDGWNVFLQQLKNGNLNNTGMFTGLASIATVPIPGALLLFGSGLLGLGRFVRRRSVAAA
jgi:hypothetical protein